jgi:hypothetical protein
MSDTEIKYNFPPGRRRLREAIEAMPPGPERTAFEIELKERESARDHYYAGQAATGRY